MVYPFIPTIYRVSTCFNHPIHCLVMNSPIFRPQNTPRKAPGPMLATLGGWQEPDKGQPWGPCLAKKLIFFEGKSGTLMYIAHFNPMSKILFCHILSMRIIIRIGRPSFLGGFQEPYPNFGLMTLIPVVQVGPFWKLDASKSKIWHEMTTASLGEFGGQLRYLLKWDHLDQLVFWKKVSRSPRCFSPQTKMRLHIHPQRSTATQELGCKP